MVSTNIQLMREYRKITQDDLAKSLGIERSTVSKWETEKAMPRAALLPKLAKVLGCSIDDLFREDGLPDTDAS